MNFFSGQVLAFDKPFGMTSFQLVSRVRWLLTRAMEGKKIKVGHAGTLDPLATGLMILCTGRATKQIEALQDGEKEYLATLRLGATTPSFDLEHPIDATFPTDHLTQGSIRSALRAFEGDLMQTPPAFSACKIEGKRAYQIARRQGAQSVVLKPKPIRISELELLRCDLLAHEVDLRIVCSKGTYIRALARDIGLALGSGAHLSALRRTRVGSYEVEKAYSLEQFEQWLGQIPIETTLPSFSPTSTSAL